MEKQEHTVKPSLDQIKSNPYFADTDFGFFNDTFYDEYNASDIESILDFMSKFEKRNGIKSICCDLYNQRFCITFDSRATKSKAVQNAIRYDAYMVVCDYQFRIYNTKTSENNGKTTMTLSYSL